ncbi:MAG: putative ABC transporter permease [Lachnospiraceae bacterium]|nr:putative ABC transporter permease [Lachnospiraceae bacterium]
MEFCIDLILIFYSFSFLGWCIEVILKYRQFGRFINRGFLMGPWLPIYGAGAGLVTLAVSGLAPVESGIGTTFAISFFVCGFIEYMTSFVMEKRFHARWWDYSQRPMNLHGRVWIGNLLLFGIGGVAVIHLANPFLYGLFHRISLPAREIIAAVLSLLFLTDYIISHFVLKLVKIGVESSEADNTEAIGRDVRMLLKDRSVFHQRFADAYPEVIYRTDRVLARMEQLHLETERLRVEAEHQLQAGKEQLKKNLEPTGSIKTGLIEKQAQLIELLYDDHTAAPQVRALMREIESEQARLEKRIIR